MSTDYLQHNLPSLVECLEEKESSFQRIAEEIAGEVKDSLSQSKVEHLQEQKSDFNALSNLAFQKRTKASKSNNQINQEKSA